MSRVFAYCRVSTIEQHTENQISEIKSAGFNIDCHRIIEEKVSGSVAALKRNEFSRLIDRLEKGDILVVTKIDRLGRNTIDVRQTVELLDEIGVKVHCLALGGVDLTSSSGKMTMTLLSAVAEFEKDLLVERTMAGIDRARASGKKFGRKPSLDNTLQKKGLLLLSEGKSISEVSRELKTSRQTIMRLRDKNLQSDAVTKAKMVGMELL